ncbi:Fructose-bisphosphate aldolase, chloroplastic [Capsicum annuum]|nr:Fructose-bisphosphate aldolase, chloroplastic [Capsicum annuum]KAF3640228.1 Fructose-bisphosphate aldolase, chloroplastic [Capsicum annuum]
MVASLGRGILVMDESNATCGKRLAPIGIDNTEANHQYYRTLLMTASGGISYKFDIPRAIWNPPLTRWGTLQPETECTDKLNFSIKHAFLMHAYLTELTYERYGPPTGANNESWCQGLDGSASRAATYSQQGDSFAKWRTVVSIPNGPSTLAVKKAASGLARYTAISQDSGLVLIMDPEVLLDGDHGMYRTFEPSMVTPGAQWKDRATREQVADYSLKILQRRIPRAVPGIMEMSFYTGALPRTYLKTSGGLPKNVKDAQDALLIRAKANSLGQLGKYTREAMNMSWFHESLENRALLTFSLKRLLLCPHIGDL